MKKLFTVPALLILFVITVCAFAVQKFDIVQLNQVRYQADNGINYIRMEAPTTLASSTTQTLTVGTGHVGLVIGTPVSGHLATYNATVGQLVDGGAVGGTCPGTATNGQVLYDNAGVCGGIANATSNGTVLAFTGQVPDTGLTTTGPDFEVGITGDTVNRAKIGLSIADVPEVSFGPGGASVRDAFFQYVAANSLRFGRPANATPAAQTLNVENALGTDIAAAASWTFIGPLATGAGTNGDIIWQTGTKVGSGSGAPTKTTGLTLKGETQAALFTNQNATGTGSTAGFQVLNNSLTTGNGLDVSSSSVTTGNLVKLASTSTAAGSNTQTVLNVATSGTNGTTTQTTFGAIVSNTHAGTASTNVALQLTASGGATSNQALNVTAGQSIFPSGTAALPAISIGGATTGFYSDAGNVIDVSVSAATNSRWSSTALGFTSSIIVGWASGDVSATAKDAAMERLATSQIAFNNGSTCGTVANCADTVTRHSLSSGTVCTIGSGFGAGAAFVDGACRDDSFRIGVGTTPGTSGVVTFGTAYANKPSCEATDETTSVITRAVATTTNVTINAVFVNNDVISVVCRGRI